MELQSDLSIRVGDFSPCANPGFDGQINRTQPGFGGSPGVRIQIGTLNGLR